MVSKVLSIAVVTLLMMMVIPCVVSGAQKEVYGAGRPNLLIGGIGQSPDTLDKGYTDFAEKYNAVYVPTYYSGNIILDAIEANKARGSYVANDQNGLSRSELKGQTYGTIFAYSGGTRSVLTALEYQGVKADTLVLISPISGTNEDQNNYYEELKQVLDLGIVKNIVVLQAPEKDTLPGNDLNGSPLLNYQARVSESGDTRIKVYDVDDQLTTSGIDAHKELFFSYATNHLPEILSAPVAGASITGTQSAAVAGATNTGTQQQESVAPASSSGSSIVGKWTLNWGDGNIDQLDLHNDGTFTETSEPFTYDTGEPLGSKAGKEVCTGKWEQNGNTNRLQYETDSIYQYGNLMERQTVIDWTANGTIEGNTMKGAGLAHVNRADGTMYINKSYDWSASRV
jgi:hypothetical protein